MFKDFMTLAQLELAGFELVNETLAKHPKYESYRRRCKGCGLWIKSSLHNGECNRCFDKENKMTRKGDSALYRGQ